MAFNPGSGASGKSSIAGSDDVALNSPVTTNVLTYDGSLQKWKNAAASQGFRARGAWLPNTTYAVNDIFTANGQTYRVINAHTTGEGGPSITGPWNNLELWAARGVDNDNNSNSIANLPAGSTIVVQKTAGGIWPGGTANAGVRPTPRADIMVMWKGPDPSPGITSSGTGGMLDNVDIRLITP